MTREEEAKLPFFNDHKEAREWFKEKYGDSFILTSSEMIDDQICNFYYLILDRKVFEAGQKEMESKGIMTDAIKFMGSYQENKTWKMEVFLSSINNHERRAED